MVLTVDELKKLIEDEKESAIKEILSTSKKFTAEVINCSEDIIDLECAAARFFEPGDIIGRVTRDSIEILGIVLDSSNEIITARLIELRAEVGERMEICEAESLISYDLQLELLEMIENRKFGRDVGFNKSSKILRGPINFKPVELFFSKKFLANLPEPEKISERLLSVDGEIVLDEFQTDAIHRILSLEDGDLLLIIGPPGTGKTRVIQKAADLLMRRGEKILITSHTNRAVDNALEKLPTEYCVRIGRPEKVLPELREKMLGYKIVEKGKKLRDLEESINTLRKERAEILSLLKEHRKFLREEQQRGKLPTYHKFQVPKELLELNRKLRELYEERNRILIETSNSIVIETPIIGATLVKSWLNPLSDVSFDTVIIDEASQASVTLALLGMTKAKKWVLIGDDKQLLPIFKSTKKISSKKNIRKQEDYSAFVYLLKNYRNRAVMLRRHYRSNSQIIGFSAKYVYDGKIEAAPECSKKKIAYKKSYALGVLDPDKPVVFVHCEGTSESSHKSRFNMMEVETCCEIVKDLINAGIDPKDIGIITPYKQQSKILAERLNKFENLEINTVDAFQGREKKVILLSLVATDPISMKFASNRNRLNVALTRAIEKLIVVGNGRAIYPNSNLLIRKFLEYCYLLGSIYDWNSRKYHPFDDERIS